MNGEIEVKIEIRKCEEAHGLTEHKIVYTVLHAEIPKVEIKRQEFEKFCLKCHP